MDGDWVCGDDCEIEWLQSLAQSEERSYRLYQGELTRLGHHRLYTAVERRQTTCQGAGSRDSRRSRANLSWLVTMTIPFQNGDPNCIYELEVAICVDGSLEATGRRATLFARLLDENAANW